MTRQVIRLRHFVSSVSCGLKARASVGQRTCECFETICRGLRRVQYQEKEFRWNSSTLWDLLLPRFLTMSNYVLPFRFCRVGSSSESSQAFSNPLFHPYHMICSSHLRGDRINIFQLSKIKMPVQKQIPLSFMVPFSRMLADSLWNYSHVTPFVVRHTSNISYLYIHTKSRIWLFLLGYQS
jgi:hypothetical protein